MFKRLTEWLKEQIRDMGLLGFLFSCFCMVLLSPFFLVILLGDLLSDFNDWTTTWFDK